MSIEAPIDLNRKRQERHGVALPQPEFTEAQLLIAVNKTVRGRLRPGSQYSQLQAERLMDVDELGALAAAKRMAEAEGQQTYPQRIAQLNTQEEDSNTEPYDVVAAYAEIKAEKKDRDQKRQRRFNFAVLGAVLLTAVTLAKACELPNPIPKPTPRPQPTFLTDKNSGSIPVINISLHNK